MPSPVGHTLAGCCVAAVAARGDAGARSAPFVAALLVAANLPDADFLIGPLPRPLGGTLAHQGPTHSLLFIAAGALALALALRGRVPLPRAWGWLLAAGAAHLLLDLANVDRLPPVGLPLLWPLSGAYLHAPFNLFPGTDRDHPLSAANVVELLVELAWTLPVLAWLLRRNRGAR
ncbi:MAG TPA: metal-dependent hydrolase [Candidatus Methanoperedens sp.]|nr:metal-dependent hydrolase [Candidatus Methanoperedens sp.]